MHQRSTCPASVNGMTLSAYKAHSAKYLSFVRFHGISQLVIGSIEVLSVKNCRFLNTFLAQLFPTESCKISFYTVLFIPPPTHLGASSRWGEPTPAVWVCLYFCWRVFFLSQHTTRPKFKTHINKFPNYFESCISKVEHWNTQSQNHDLFFVQIPSRRATP